MDRGSELMDQLRSPVRIAVSVSDVVLSKAVERRSSRNASY